jgi:formylmethanofuran dehydrogenase subunit E
MSNILKRDFKYVHSMDTDLKKSFKRIRKQQKQEELERQKKENQKAVDQSKAEVAAKQVWPLKPVSQG